MKSSYLFECFKHNEFPMQYAAGSLYDIERSWEEYRKEFVTPWFEDLISGVKKRRKWDQEKIKKEKTVHANTKRKAHRETKEAFQNLEQCRNCSDIDLCFKISTLTLLKKMRCMLKLFMKDKRSYNNSIPKRQLSWNYLNYIYVLFLRVPFLFKCFT